MTRLLLAFAGIVLLVVTALGVLWLAGEMLVGAGLLAVGTAGVLLRLLWFLVLSAVVGGAVYFVANAWRPVGRGQMRPLPARASVAAVAQSGVKADMDDGLMGQG